jgi:predicted permease
MDIELLEGRLFTDADRADVDRVVIVDEAMAREFWPDASPIGRRVRYGDINSTSRWETVVGVVRQVKHYGPDADARIALYRPLTQSGARTLFVTVRTDEPPAAVLPRVRDVIRGVDPDLPMTNVATMRERLDRSLARREFAMLLLMAFAGVAAVLATIGVYGVMAYLVAQGRRELGIRIALGASGGAIVRLVLGHGLTVTVAGLVAGLAVAALVTRVMAGMLFGVEPLDLATFGTTALGLTATAIAAALIPSWRASRTDPTIALRAE